MGESAYFERKIDRFLYSWARDKDRKPLLLRGARQVGKSSAVRNLGKSFKNFVEINFDKDKDIHTFFENINSPQAICEQLSIFYKKEITPSKTLVFFNEIHSCHAALAKLKYFYEKYPQLHLIASGSLLEFAIEEMPSLAVEKTDSLYMYPFSFEEFMLAQKKEMLVDAYRQATPEKSLSEQIHNDLRNLFKNFLVTGGMPNSVAKYIETGSLQETQMIIDGLISMLRSDFTKYKKGMPSVNIENVFESVANQIHGKFVYENVGHFNNVQVKQSLELLIMAGLVIPVTHSSANNIPIIADANFKHSRMLLWDTGVFLRMLGFDSSKTMTADDFKTINMEDLIVMSVGLEILKASSCYTPQQLYYWYMEKKQNNAQVDYVIQKNDCIIPIEVKSGLKEEIPILRIFMEEKKSKFAIRTSSENFGKLDNVENYPLYAISNVILQ